MLLAVANEQNTNYKVRFIRTRDILGKLTYTEKQRKELTRYIPEYMSRNEDMDNKLWLYVPTMIRLKDGKSSGRTCRAFRRKRVYRHNDKKAGKGINENLSSPVKVTGIHI